MYDIDDLNISKGVLVVEDLSISIYLYEKVYLPLKQRGLPYLSFAQNGEDAQGIYDSEKHELVVIGKIRDMTEDDLARRIGDEDQTVPILLIGHQKEKI